MTIIEFMLARIAEDETRASAATPGPWRYDPTKVNAIDRGEAVFAGPRGATATTVASTGPADDPVSMADAAHIARWDPARVLAECDTKRRIIDFHANWPVLVEGPPQFEQTDGANLSSMAVRVTRQMDWLTQQEYIRRFGAEPPTTPMLRLLAQPYADHPDYRAEWRP